MKKSIGSFAVVAAILPFLSQTASAFSVSARTYSTEALRLLITNQDILNQIPNGESITRIEQVSRQPYQFEVSAGECTLRVEVSTKTPTGFIGTGLPHDPKVVDATGCQQ